MREFLGMSKISWWFCQFMWYRCH